VPPPIPVGQRQLGFQSAEHQTPAILREPAGAAIPAGSFEHKNSFEGPATLITSHHGLYRHIPFIGSQIAKTQQNRGVLQIPAESP
jgi:hypothetical protein